MGAAAAAALAPGYLELAHPVPHLTWIWPADSVQESAFHSEPSPRCQRQEGGSGDDGTVLGPSLALEGCKVAPAGSQHSRTGSLEAAGTCT